MKVLFSPSERKSASAGTSGNVALDSKSYIFPALFDKRLEILTQYRAYVLRASNDQLIKLFGTKKQSVIDYYSDDIFKRVTMKVIERYKGVAFDYLDYATLDKGQKIWIDDNTIIFSNLFGPLLAGDEGLPDYKLKQGEKIGELPLESFYRAHFERALDAFLEKEHILDLRAGFYNKFYKSKTPYTTLKFVKDGKVVSHWSKAYRGIVLRELALHKIETIDEFVKLKLPNLKITKTSRKGLHQELVFEVEAK